MLTFGKLSFANNSAFVGAWYSLGCTFWESCFPYFCCWTTRWSFVIDWSNLIHRHLFTRRDTRQGALMILWWGGSLMMTWEEDKAKNIGLTMMMVFLRAEEHRYLMIKMYQKRITIRDISKTHRRIALRASPRTKLWTNPMKTSERQRKEGRLLWIHILQVKISLWGTPLINWLTHRWRTTG